MKNYFFFVEVIFFMVVKEGLRPKTKKNTNELHEYF